MGIGELWDALVSAVCRPPRDSQYTVEDLVGGASRTFKLPNHLGLVVVREDLVLVNKRGLKLQCSWYKPENIQGRDGKLPCVIYCHCNSGSRRDCEEALYQLLPNGVTVFSLDFAGSGLSEGEWVTLGAHEVDDVEVAVKYLRSCGKVSTLGLWGRSMGAVTALLYSQRDPSIAGMVLDSPFSCLTDLMMELVSEQDLPIPKALMKVALACMKRSVRKRAGFDITEVAPINVVSQSFIPALFCHATGDTFIKIHHSEKLYEAYAGDKNFVKVDGDHNSPRPKFFKASVSIFFTTTLRLDEMIVGGNCELLRWRGRTDNINAAAQAAADACADTGADPMSITNSTLHPGHGGIPWELQSLRSTGSIPRLPTSTSAGEGGPAGPPGNTATGNGTRLLEQGGPTRTAMPNEPEGLQGTEDVDQDALEDAQFELMLEQAMQASLLEQHGTAAKHPASQQEVASKLAAGSNYAAQVAQNGRMTQLPSAAAAGASRSSRVSGGVPAAPGKALQGIMPSTVADEEEMLQRAITMSLQEAGSHAASAVPSDHGTTTAVTATSNALGTAVKATVQAGRSEASPAVAGSAVGAAVATQMPQSSTKAAAVQNTNYVDLLDSELSAGLLAGNDKSTNPWHAKAG